MITKAQAAKRLNRIEKGAPPATDVISFSSSAELEADMARYCGVEAAKQAVSELSTAPCTGKYVNYDFLSTPVLITLEKYLSAKV